MVTVFATCFNIKSSLTSRMFVCLVLLTWTTAIIFLVIIFWLVFRRGVFVWGNKRIFYCYFKVASSHSSTREHKP
jgi:hypothetical protein